MVQPLIEAMRADALAQPYLCVDATGVLVLAKEVLGRKNWRFVGSDDGGEINATFVSLLASCNLHKLEPLYP